MVQIATCTHIEEASHTFPCNSTAIKGTAQNSHPAARPQTSYLSRIPLRLKNTANCSSITVRYQVESSPYAVRTPVAAPEISRSATTSSLAPCSEQVP